MTAPELFDDDVLDDGLLGLVVGGALALARHHFPQEDGTSRPTVAVADAHFLLSGQMEAWQAWPHLPERERLQIARLLRDRPVQLANRHAFATAVQQLLAVGGLPGFRPADDDDQVLTELGVAAQAYADENLAALEARRRRLGGERPVRYAKSGEYVTELRAAPGGAPWAHEVAARYRLNLAIEPQPADPPDIGTAAEGDMVELTQDELRTTAAELDATKDCRHYGQSVNALLDRLRSDTDGPLGQVLRIDPGLLRLIVAPTGLGKSVLVEVMACCLARRGLVLTVLVPTNAMAVALARTLEADFAALAIPREVTPLVSPDAMQHLAETTAGRAPAGDQHAAWVYERLAYGCALPAAASTEEQVDTWQPGTEPCVDLRPASTEGRPGPRHVCPWRDGCGKFRLVRAACRASVIVTTHGNFLAGRLRIPVRADGIIDHAMPVEELLVRRSHLVIIDEVDAFQAHAISRSARGLLLDHRSKPDTPLKRLDAEFSNASSRLDQQVEANVRAALLHTRYLAEAYNSNLARGRFVPLTRGRSRRNLRLDRWLVPRRWDAALAARLCGLDEGTLVTDEHMAVLQSLFPDGNATRTPSWLEPARAALFAVASNTGDDTFVDCRRLLVETLEERVEDEETRIWMVDRLLRRAYLERIRSLLFRFVYNAAQLQASGVTAAREVAEAMAPHATWRAAPFGPLGRLLFAFTEHYDDTRPHDTRLRVSGFGGDPHLFTTTIGELTALARIGRRRAVLGLSATAFLPGAPHHHVHTRPTWYVSDDQGSGIRVEASPVSDDERQQIRISGTYGPRRREALLKLGILLWKKRLEPALRDLAAAPGTAHRSRVLVATTSYQGTRDLIEGIARAQVPAGDLCLAVRPDDRALGPRSTGQWTELPADRLEEFGTTVDARVLVAPLARVARGLNIVDPAGRSRIGSIWLVVRPIPLMDEPAELLAHVNARAHTETTASSDPAAVIDIRRQIAGRHYDELFTSSPFFRSLPKETRLAITAETLIGLIQLAGRARRGGELGVIHLVDHAFLDPSGKSDLPRLIRDLRAHWTANRDLDLVRTLYGQTLEELFDFADRRSDEPC
jgi:hypothetical protein